MSNFKRINFKQTNFKQIIEGKYFFLKIINSLSTLYSTERGRVRKYLERMSNFKQINFKQTNFKQTNFKQIKGKYFSKKDNKFIKYSERGLVSYRK